MSTSFQATTLIAEDGTPITVNVPVGSLDEPTERGKALMAQVENPEGWKLPTNYHFTADLDEAQELAYTLDWYLGGHEFRESQRDGSPVYIVHSHGYYHYVGA